MTAISYPDTPQPSWHNTPSGTMTAAVLKENPSLEKSPLDSFTYQTDYPKPTLPSRDWCLVRVRAAGLNRAELRGRAALPPGKGELNIFQNEYHEDPPAILGEELVGEVAEAGSDSGFQVGEIVTAFIYGGGKAHDGAYAQYSIAHKRRLYRLPFKDSADVERRTGWNVLGAIPMSMWTAYGSIFEAGRLGHRGKGKDETLLIHGGTSSVGIWAILLAKEQGFKVVATTRKEKKTQRLKDAGADHIILDQDLETSIPKLFPDGVDVVLELVGPDMIQRALSWTARPAMIPTCRNLTFYGMTNRGSLGPDDEGLEQVEPTLKHVVEKVEDGTFGKEVFLDRTFELKDIGKAHEYMENNEAVGKVVVLVP
ncbi:hypothetical protein LTS08_006921 [Lithohypha guttulata]|uniref:uncharacterized protein n=1 Tax=Lithohypha guttulata TaxID=1690604 RepID=UPI002DE19528|nr:hypothetical protein LTR51_001973 [Lithohypha guttulata]KAK5097508.1 hypothetical protein LTS08_006921 [Lithohypha guttulata]